MDGVRPCCGALGLGEDGVGRCPGQETLTLLLLLLLLQFGRAGGGRCPGLQLAGEGTTTAETVTTLTLRKAFQVGQPAEESDGRIHEVIRGSRTRSWDGERPPGGEGDRIRLGILDG